MKSLTHLPDDALTARLYEIRKQERHLLVEFLSYLAEVDKRKTAVALGYANLFAFCTDYLRLTKGSAFRRTKAAWLLGRFPIIADYLADGRLNLTTLVELRDVLEEKRLVEILDRAAGRTEDDVKKLVAALRPQPAPADLLRKLPTPRDDSKWFGPNQPAAPAAQPAAPPAVQPATAPGPAPAAVTAAPPLPLFDLPRPVERPPARIQPIAPERSVLRVTVSDAFVADLDAVKQALSHKLPAGNLEDVLHECIRVTLDAYQRRRRGTGKRTTAEAPPPGSPYIPVAVRDEVWKRDAGMCTFIGRDGRRCSSTHQLQFHHRDPRGMNGPATVANITLHRAHNLFAAEQDYGAEHISRMMRR